MTNFKKAALTSTIVLVLILSTALASFAVNSGTIKKEAKLRKTASDDSIVLEIIPNKEEVEILEVGDEWYKVNYKKIKGYVKKEFIEVEEVKDAENNTTQESEQVTNENNEVQKLQKGDIAIIKNKTSIHARPLVNSIVKADIEQNKKAEIITIINNWAYVSTENQMGWVKLEELAHKEQQNQTQKNDTQEPKKEETTNKELNKKGYITSTGINFREEANTDSKVLKVFIQNTSVTILEENGEWYKIKYKDQTGYVLKTYVSSKKVETTSRSAESREKTAKETQTVKEENKTAKITTTKPASAKGQEIANYAKNFVGKKYVYGGSTPSGFDCSGLTMYVYSKYGVSLPHSATAQSKRGTKVSKAELQPGDLVFFTNYRTNKGIGHVGIYIGNNQFVHASTEKTGVIISSLSGKGYASRYVSAVRLVNN